MPPTYSIELKNVLPEISRLGTFIETMGTENTLPAKTIHALLLSSDELVTNIISYGYADSMEHRITVAFVLSESAVNMTIADDGCEFNPLAVQEADTSAPLEEKPIGGLGIHLVKSMVDEITYRYDNNRNIVTVLKNFS